VGEPVTFTDSSPGTPTFSIWLVDDTLVSFDRNYTHIFSMSGTHGVNHRVQDTYGPYLWKNVTITVSSPALAASFSAYPQSGPAPLAVQFLDYTPDARAWAWEFGDGGMSDRQYPVHVYDRSGLYTVTLTATDSSGRIATKTENYLIHVTKPVTPSPTAVANFSANRSSGAAPLGVAFAGTSSPTSFHRWWQFGDGASSTDADPVHTFAMEGTYTVNLTVWTSLGPASRTGTFVVGADARAPVANFTLSRSGGTAPLYVRFTDCSTGTPTSWRWDFGGLAWTAARNPAVVFRQPGTYAVALTARNTFGSSSMTKNLTATGSAARSAKGDIIGVVGSKRSPISGTAPRIVCVETSVRCTRTHAPPSMDARDTFTSMLIASVTHPSHTGVW
jgi:PKD repeat protein